MCASNNRNITLIKHFKEVLKYRHEYVDVIMADKDTFEFIFRIRNMKGSNDEFIGGEYLLRLIPPDNYPYKPPDFKFLTPNGIYELNSSVCLSTGKYHPQQYRATGGMAGLARDIWTAMIMHKDIGGGISIISEKKRNIGNMKVHAARSKKFNRKNYKNYIDKFDRLPMNIFYEFMCNNEINNKRIRQLTLRFLGL